jgi:hypothetical protein
MFDTMGKALTARLSEIDGTLPTVVAYTTPGQMGWNYTSEEN